VTEFAVRQHGNTTAVDLSYVSCVVGDRSYGGWYRPTSRGTIELIALGTIRERLRDGELPLDQARAMLKEMVDKATATAFASRVIETPAPTDEHEQLSALAIDGSATRYPHHSETDRTDSPT
jgi:hypothetical protein